LASAADALAKRRLTDEYDAAQLKGEVAPQGKPSKTEGLATVADVGLSRKDIHEARQIRDAEDTAPAKPLIHNQRAHPTHTEGVSIQCGDGSALQ
jgi:hypothetical protein